MAKPDIHLALLHDGPSHYHPDARCLTFEDDFDKATALSRAEMVLQNLPNTRGTLFIEQTGMPATVHLNCIHCNSRKNRSKYLFFI